MSAIGWLLIPTSIFTQSSGHFIDRLEEYMSGADPKMVFQFRLFLRLLPLLAFILRGKPLARYLEKDGQTLFAFLENAPLAKIKQGFWGMKNIFFFVYYTDQSVFPSLDYEGPLEDAG